MKTSIILLFLSTLAFGQIDSSNVYDHRIGVGEIKHIEKITNEINFIWEKDLPKEKDSLAWIWESRLMIRGQILSCNRNGKDYILYDFFAKMFLSCWDEYSKECYADTLIAKPYEGEYVVTLVADNGDKITWMLTDRQLNDMGYFYNYKWLKDVINGIFVFDYYFIKEPTIQGFIEFLRRKIK